VTSIFSYWALVDVRRGLHRKLGAPSPPAVERAVLADPLAPDVPIGAPVGSSRSDVRCARYGASPQGCVASLESAGRCSPAGAWSVRLVIRVRAAGVVGDVDHLGDLGHGLEDHGLDALAQGGGSHPAALTPAAEV
jgi:hypothetical protein